MRGLRVRIDNEKSLQFAVLWVTTCIHLHAFAIQHEGGKFESSDKFYQDGIKIMRKERRAYQEWLEERQRHADEVEEQQLVEHELGLLEGRLKREELKEDLLRYLEMHD